MFDTQATNDLRLHVDRLKKMYHSGFRVLDDLAGELGKISGDALGRLNSQVSLHSSALEDVSKLFPK